MIQLKKYTSTHPLPYPSPYLQAPGLPKTRSGKIMRRILRKIANYVSDHSSWPQLLN